MEPTKISKLRCEYLSSPLGIDEQSPRLSWNLETDRRGARQVAYRILVASSAAKLDGGLGDLWDSGRVESDATTHIVYQGCPLRSRMRCHWQVEVWDETGDGARSVPALWTMGLLAPEDWHSVWLTHDLEIIVRDPDAVVATATEPGSVPLFRRQFDVPNTVRRATLYATACGLLDLSLNGQAVTDDQLVPEWTDYNHRLHYRTFDVTQRIQPGENALGVVLGDGWWSGYIGWQETRGQYGTLENKFRLQLEIELEDGQSLVIGSDDQWRCNTGPLIYSDFMMGERYDARRERTGWNMAPFDSSGWLPAQVTTAPCVHIPKFGFSDNVASDTEIPLPLVAQRAEPVRVVETITPVSANEVEPGVFIYDLGQNISGWVRLSVNGRRGAQVQLRHGERLTPEGTLYTENLRRAKATDFYVLKGAGTETWEPVFTFHGFQYIEVAGLDEAEIKDICGCVMMSATPPAGQFECSHPLVNRLWQNALWGQKGNFLSVPTDCPQRDERLGWMGDAQVFLRTAAYNMDVAAFFTKWMTDVTDSQDVDGIFPDVAPRLREGDNFVGLDGLGGAAGWADAGVIIPWTMWQVYGDLRLAERHWDAMIAWLDWLQSTNPDGIRRNCLNNNYGDWLCIPSDTSFRTESPLKTLLATAFWAEDARMAASLAAALDRDDDVARLNAMHHHVRDAFQAEWLLDDGRLVVETQTSYLLALAFDLIPDELRDRAVERLVANIEDLDGHLSTGFIGIRLLNPILTQFGRADVAYRLLCNEDYPSWLYPVLHGATTIWERWNGWTEEEGFFNPQMNSFNHYSLGSVGEWLYRSIGGIELDPTNPGFKHILIKPHVQPQLDFAMASYESIHGRIATSWRTKSGELELAVRIPPNTTATISIPCSGNAKVTAHDGSGSLLELGEMRRDGGFVLVDATAGEYVFIVQN